MLYRIKVNGPCKILGEVKTSGAKNAALPLLIATLLSEEECILENVPNIYDISMTLEILRSFGATYSRSNGSIKIKTEKVVSSEARYSLVKAMRASFWTLGPLVIRKGSAKVSLPGGDAIGSRPVDLHLMALEKLGINVRLEHGVVNASISSNLRGANIHFDFPSVGATIHTLLTASAIEDKTVLTGAAKEPEIIEIANFLNSMGAIITGAGSDTITIHGAKKLSGAKCKVEGDRIEAATYLCAAAITGGEISISDINSTSLLSTIEALKQFGCIISIKNNLIYLKAPKELSPCTLETNPYPGLATDAGPLLAALMCKANGTSKLVENIFDNRFGYLGEYLRFGAKITTSNNVAVFEKNEKLSAAPVEATDIRGGVGMLLLSLACDGISSIGNVHHIERGYDDLIEKLKSLGASISLTPDIDALEITDIASGC